VVEKPVEKLRFAHVGCGVWGSNLVRELAAHPGVSLELVIDADARARERARALAPGVLTASSVEALSDRPFDAVVIASPGPLHARHAMAAMALGAHVFVEKPMTTSVVDARAMLARCRSRRRIGMVGHLLHHHAAVRTMLQLVSDGRIGTPLAFRSARLCQRSSRDADGSLLWSLAPHDMSVLRALDSGPVRKMQVELRSLGNVDSTPNVADLRLRLAGGLEAHIVVSRAHRTKVRRMELIGEDATLVFDDVAATSKLTLRWRGEVEDVAYDETVSPLRAELDAFVSSVQRGTRPEIGFDEGLEVVELLERAHAVASRTSESPALSAAR